MILVLGSGVAGLSCALAAAEAGADVMLVTPGDFDEQTGAATAAAGGNTALAQGGIAAAVGSGDSPELHAADTIAAGAGLVDEQAARVLTGDGAALVKGVINSGFAVDRQASGAHRGELSFGLEAAHGRARIVHAGEDRTGAALHAYLGGRLAALVRAGRLRVVAGASAVSLLEHAGAVNGAVLRHRGGELSAVRADAVVLATGGYAAVYAQTSNAPTAIGEGIVLAARAGAVIADLEFVQFHPTVLAGTGLLISEAVRGAGAVLLDDSGDRFMRAAHQAAELAPRDVVSRTAHRIMRQSGAAQVWLDASGIERDLGRGTLARRFPALTAATRAHGFDWAREAVPVAPAAHYTMGGIATDLDGRTSVPGLFAVGEVACTGVHGANRLASNSLLEGLVFGSRAASAAQGYVATAPAVRDWELNGLGIRALVRDAAPLPRTEAVAAASDIASGASASAASAIAAASAVASASAGAVNLRDIAAAELGIERDADGIARAVGAAQSVNDPMAELVLMMARAAEARTESRGAHQRSDFPGPDRAQQLHRGWTARPSGRAPAELHRLVNQPDQSDLDPRSVHAC